LQVARDEIDRTNWTAPTLICLKPAFSSLSFADFTAWKANSEYQPIATMSQTPDAHLRVGEAFTKDKKSSALFDAGLGDMVWKARDRMAGSKTM